MKEGTRVYLDFGSIPALAPILARHEARGEGRGYALLQLVSASLGVTNVSQALQLTGAAQGELQKILLDQLHFSNLAIVTACRAFGMTQEEWETAGVALFTRVEEEGASGDSSVH